MPVLKDGIRTTDVLVLRVDGPTPAFRWEVRAYNRAFPIEKSDRTYPSIAAARAAGEDALAKLQGETETRSVPDTPAATLAG